MDADRVQSGEIARVWAFGRNAAGVGVTGATLTAGIRRDVTNTWWNGSGFQSSYTTVSLTEADATNLPGLYYYDLSLPVSQDGNVIIYVSTSTAAIVNGPWIAQVKVGGFVNYINADLETISQDVDVLNPSTTLLGLLRSQLIILGQSVDKINNDVGRLLRASGLSGGI